jgi:DNA-binding MarR family transcriptional regulator
MVVSESDEVDRIQWAWRGLRPELDVSSIGIVTRVWRIGRLLDEQRQALLDEFETDRMVVDVLAELRRCGPPHELTAGDLRQASKISSGGMSQRLARLESLGLIVRSIDEADRRSVRVRLTEAGTTLIDAIVTEITRREAVLLDGLPDQDRAELERLLRRLLAMLDGDRRAPGPSPVT